jgi:FAD/FMN-containing dehydrogenase
VKACRDLGVDFVISGGRHSASGASSIENGAVIDLRLMNKVTVDPEVKTVTAEGGALWADLDEEAAKYDLCAVGGKLPDAPFFVLSVSNLSRHC